MKSLFQSIPEPDLLSGNSSRDKERQGEKKGGWRNKVAWRDNRRVRPPILNLRRRNKPRDKTAPVSGESIIFFKTAINLLHCLMCYWEVFSSSPNWFWSDLFPIHPQNQKKPLKINLNFLLHVALKRVSCFWRNIVIVGAEIFLHV